VTDQGVAALVFFKDEREGYDCFERDGFRVRVFFICPQCLFLNSSCKFSPPFLCVL
jgi:hypothetical protein